MSIHAGKSTSHKSLPAQTSLLLSFARKATEVLHKFAHDLASQNGLKAYCSQLEWNLSQVHQKLQQLHDLTDLDSNKIFQLLYCLELLSSPLSNSCHRPDVTPETFDRPCYPNLHALTSGRSQITIKINIRALATNHIRKGETQAGTKTKENTKKRRKTILESLRAFLDLEQIHRGPSQHEMVTTTEKIIDADDHSLYLKDLYTTIRDYCFCRGLKDSCGIITILRLRNWKKATDRLKNLGKTTDVDDGVCFDLLFLGHPHHNENSEEGSEWQGWLGTCICVALSKQTSLVGFKEVSDLQPPQMASNQLVLNDTAEFIPKEKFCPWVSHNLQTQCCAVCVASDGQLRRTGAELISSNLRILLKFPSVSLATLLDKYLLFNVQQKALLSYLIVKAVCEFYYSDWMTKEWSKHSIHFMFHESQPHAIYVSDPFIEADFRSSLSVEPTVLCSHRYPKILALGIMLLEIELGRNLLDQNGHEPNSIQNGKHIAATKILGTEAWIKNKNGTYEHIRDIIKICVGPDLEKLGIDSDNLRNALHRELVVPCREFFFRSWKKDPDTFNIDLEYFADANSDIQARNQTPSQVLPSPIVLHASRNQEQSHVPVQRPKRQFEFSSGTMVRRDGETSSKAWMEELDIFIDVLQARKKSQETDAKHQRAKIAILDTGIRSNHGQAKAVHYVDFVDENSTEKSDSSGHGSNSVDLVLKVYASADLYVARIFGQDTSEEENGPKLMAKGITWAIEEKVDIISISAGFKPGNGCPRDLRKAVDKAAKAGVLVFAAASNWSNKDDVAWPAAIREQVICIFATHGWNRAVRRLNPDPRVNADNFAILGSDVEIDPNKKPEEGTSISTALAAGLAGLLIDFGRQSDCREVIDGDILATKTGMSAVFREMSTGKGEGYNCMIPWRILNSAPTNPSRAEKRKVVRETLASALRMAT